MQAQNRAKALQRIRQRQNGVKQGFDEVNSGTSNRIQKDTFSGLSKEQQALIERNREKALERFKLRQGFAAGQRDGSQYKPQVPGAVESSDNLNNKGDAVTKYIRPSVRKSDYIEYDFSTMQDTYGGFVSGRNVDKNGKPIEMSLEEWKRQQKEKQELDSLQDDEYELPPVDDHDAPKCHECNSIEIDKKMLEIFGCLVCKRCKEKFPNKYSLLTKTECKEDYFLTDPELADETLFRRIIKENPHSGTFSRMQLFLRYQIEEYAFKKWGGEKKLDEEWLRREEMRKKRRERKFNNKLKDMRKKLRAEELTRNLRLVRDNKHTHDWSAPIRKVDKETNMDNIFVKRCTECGMEVEEVLI